LLFDRICEARGIEHRLAKPDHPSSNGKDKRTDRTIKAATNERVRHDSHPTRCPIRRLPCALQLRMQGQDPRRRDTVQCIRKNLAPEQNRFILDAMRQVPGLKSNLDALT